MSALRSCLFALVLAAWVAPLSAQTIRGRAIDALTGEGVPAATITALGPDQRAVGRARTAPDGSFELLLRSAGAYVLRGERAGYSTTLSQVLEVGVRETWEIELRLSVAPLTVEPVTVTARSQPPKIRSLENNGFYRREAAGFGKFLRREDIERTPSLNVAQILARAPGGRLYKDRAGREFIYFPRSAGLKSGQSVCLPRLLVDGMAVMYELGTRGADINQSVLPEQIEAIELYRGPSELPQEFNNSEAACGVIVIWTRSRR